MKERERERERESERERERKVCGNNNINKTRMKQTGNEAKQQTQRSHKSHREKWTETTVMKEDKQKNNTKKRN